jgi:hypothetical protein
VFPAGVASALPGFYFGQGAIVRPRRSFSTPATLYQTVPPPRRAVGLLLNRGTFAPSSQLRSVSRDGGGERKRGIVVSKSWSIVASRAETDSICSMPYLWHGIGDKYSYTLRENCHNCPRAFFGAPTCAAGGFISKYSKYRLTCVYCNGTPSFLSVCCTIGTVGVGKRWSWHI